MDKHDTKLTICPRCAGEGRIPFATGDERLYEYKTCHECGGVGIMKRIVTIRFEKLRYHPLMQIKLNDGPEQIQDDKPGMDPGILPRNG